MKDSFTSQNFLNSFTQDEISEIKEKVSLVQSIDSTNTFLMKESSKFIPLLDDNGTITKSGSNFNFTLKAAETQTNGRGRMGRKFLSPISSGIYFSIAYVKEGGIENPALITVSACIGICRAIEKTYGIECRIKWVNDIYCNGKKVCGILTEGIINSTAARIDGCIIGIGINLKTDNSFDAELKSKAGGILDNISENPLVPARAEFLATCYKEIKKILTSKENIMSEYKNRSLLSGKTVTVTPVIGDDRTSYTAMVKDISDNGELIVQLKDGTEKKLSSGEVSLHGTAI